MKIYILHGWTYNLEKWEKFSNILNKENLDPVLLKIPGLTEKITKPWRMEDYVKWLNEKLVSEKEKTILIGHSNGGRIAMAYSMRYPGKIKKIFLIDSAGIYHTDFYIKTKRKIFGKIAKAGRKLLKLKIAKDFLYLLVGERDYKEASSQMKKTMVNLLSWEKTFDPAKVKIPTIIIWGKKDGITPLSDGVKLHESIANSKLFIVDKAGHSPQFSHPEKVSEIIAENI